MLLVLSLVLVSGLLAVTSRNIVYAVIALLSTNITLAIAYYMMGAPTVALFQLAIFAGAVVVFFVITVMLTSGGDMEYDDEPSLIMNKKVQLGLAILTVVTLVGIGFTSDFSFPFLQYSSDFLDIISIPSGSYDTITNSVSQFLWERRSLDLISQSFVVLTAIICCIAMLKIVRSHK